MENKNEKIISHLLNKQKIEAIKEARFVYGLSLKEAKDYVEKLIDTDAKLKVLYLQEKQNLSKIMQVIFYFIFSIFVGFIYYKFYRN